VAARVMHMRTAQLNKAVPLFAALGDAVRLSIMARLSSEGPLPTVQLKQRTNLSRQAVTKHLRMLEDVGLVHSDRVGRDRLWRIETHQLAEIRKYLDQISALWDARLERLRTFVENDVN
jgi:DNA-binding transcriptional ArsR family regulator